MELDERQRSPKAIGRRLRRARLARGLMQEDIAEACQVTRAAVSQWERGESRADIDKLELVARRLRVEMEWLRTGKGLEPDLPKPPTGARRMRYIDVEPPPSLTDSTSLRSPPFIGAIPDMQSGVGAGSPYAAREPVADWWRLPGTFIKDTLGANVSALRVFRVRAVNMEPTIRRGAHVVVDLAQTAPADGGIFAIDNGFSLVLKRVSVLSADRLRLSNDSGRNGVEFKAREVSIIGRVLAQITPV